MENERHYFTVGVFVLGGFLAIFAFVIWLTHQDQGEYEHYYIRFAESVSGLSKGSVVKFRGVSVGTVDDIVIDSTDSRLIRVDISLLKSTPLKIDTKASLKMQGITGIVFVELQGGDPSLPDLEKKKDSDDVAEIPAQQSSINQIIDAVPTLLAKFSATLDQINKAVSDENIASIHTTLAHSAQATGDLHAILSESRTNLNQSTTQAAEAMRHLNHAASNADTFSDKLSSDPAALLFPPREQGIQAP